MQLCLTICKAKGSPRDAGLTICRAKGCPQHASLTVYEAKGDPRWDRLVLLLLYSRKTGFPGLLQWIAFARLMFLHCRGAPETRLLRWAASAGLLFLQCQAAGLLNCWVAAMGSIRRAAVLAVPSSGAIELLGCCDGQHPPGCCSCTTEQRGYWAAGATVSALPGGWPIRLPGLPGVLRLNPGCWNACACGVYSWTVG